MNDSQERPNVSLFEKRLMFYPNKSSVNMNSIKKSVCWSETHSTFSI